MNDTIKSMQELHNYLTESLKESPSLIEVLQEIRDDIRAMRKIAEAKQEKQYETKTVTGKELRFKGQYENTGAMEVPVTKNGFDGEVG